jgi:hypothetical protein
VETLDLDQVREHGPELHERFRRRQVGVDLARSGSVADAHWRPA